MQTENRIVGIMACETEGDPPFGERLFYERLCRIGAKHGLLVYVFSPVRLNQSRQTVTGHTYRAGRGKGGWKQEEFPLPDLIYNRSFYANEEQRRRHRECLRRVVALKPAVMLGRGLPGKWEAQQSLLRDPQLRPHVPETRRWAGAHTLESWLDAYGEALLKPESGTHGRGVLHVRRTADGYALRGRDGDNRPVAEAFAALPEAVRRVSRLIGRRPYLVQRYLTLHDGAGDAYDVRALMQKDGRGEWTLTGIGVRRGRPGSLTSNLHGGGTAEEAAGFLAGEFGPAHAGTVLAEAAALARRIPPALERSFGRLAELGIDLGVDRSGRLWIIEANSMPGRALFGALSDKRAAACAVGRPIAYARYLLERRHTGAAKTARLYVGG